MEVPEEGKIITVSQKKLFPAAKGDYELSFDARTEGGDKNGLTVEIFGKEYTPELSASSGHFSEKLSLENEASKDDSLVNLKFTKKGTYYIDNLSFCEAALIKNGSFNAGLTGFTPYVYDSVKATYVVDNMNGNDNTFAITIDDTVATDEGNAWYIQLNQDGITLTEGKTYRLSFKARATTDRAIAYSLQQYEGDWTNYSGTEEPVMIGADWTTFTTEFKMEYPTDTNSRFNITLGSVGGTRISGKHDVYIDDITLLELD